MNPTTRLSAPESTRLAELEPIVEQGLKNFREVGEALAEISDRRLYRGTHSTFKEYVQAKWDLSVRTAYDYIEAAETLKSLPAQCAKFAQTAPAAQVKKLSQVPVEKRAEVVEVAASRAKSEDRPMTAADITQAALPAPDWEAKANERIAARNATEPTAPDGYSVLKDRVEREFHKFMDKFEASELPEVRRIIRPWVVRG